MYHQPYLTDTICPGKTTSVLDAAALIPWTSGFQMTSHSFIHSPTLQHKSEAEFQVIS